jgi:hypothetical protein
MPKQKTPAGMLAFPDSGAILPTQHYTLEDIFCQGKRQENSPFGGRPRNGREESTHPPLQN